MEKVLGLNELIIILCGIGHALAKHYPYADDTVIEEWLQSNLCRCTGYEEIEDAVKSIITNQYQ